MRTWMAAAALAGLVLPAAAQEQQEQDYGKEQKKQEKSQKQKSPQEQTQGAELHAAWYDNWISGVHFRLDPQGRVFLMVPDKNRKGQFKTYQADSMQSFRREHADVVRRHDLETLFGLSERQEKQRQEDGESARDFQNREELRSWVQQQHQALRENLGEWRQEGRSAREDRMQQDERSGREGRSLGIVVAPLGPALQAQLGLEEGQGFVVHRIEPGSLAEKSGLRKYDVIAELKGRGVDDFQDFRSNLEALLSKDQPFELGVIRNGERRSVKVQPVGEGREAK